ncbi:hypothetical protein KPL71_007588 [Citrus sinensis]|uniref:Uncharacterized protein n=1 Tax=Citrus sinensis TaxID=2711 RepID=A0ACB8M1F3_CITSI|nr:hypothetical protein KPL71_007588 [Citrus sinensis]
MASSKVDLEKFTGKNDFNMWKIKMEALLITQGLGDAIEFENNKDGRGVSSSKTPEEAAEINKRARSAIILSLGDSVIREVAKEKTVVGLWAKLESLYMTKSLANRLYIKKRMFTLRMVEGSSLEEYIDEFNKVCDTLETIDVALDDKGKALLLISSLPKSYENLVDALMYGRQTLIVNAVKSALNTRGLQEKQTHLQNDFPEKQRKPKDSRNQNGDAAVVKEEGYESAGVCVAIENNRKGKWVLDSGCTFHMCPVKTYFTEYQEIDGGRVIMGNNSICRIIGIGNVSLRLHDGSTRVINQVRHVPDLKRNLISLGMLDQIGCKIRLESGQLCVLNGSNLVMKGTRKNGVYILDGEVISGEIGKLEFCEVCVLGKSSRGSFKRSSQKSLDDFSRKVWVYVLKNKDQVFEKIKEWKHLVENQIGQRSKKLRTNNGLEFCNQHFDSFCAAKGITRLRTSKLPKTLWAETLLTTCYLVNLSPSTAISFKTPFEMWYGRPADYGILKAYGCPAYVHISQGKLAPRALKCVFIGYPEGVKGFKVWCTDLNPPRCIVSRDIVFNEGGLIKDSEAAEDENEKSRSKDRLELEVESSVLKNSTEAADSGGANC